ncbi:signal peptidase I [Alcanivorax hongdengensis A-11-3]|uniref:Signal peptidase I n=1 Tax=Alcanivorax hongdengensis A-11-3 TaxID=1177179 RepID=L0WB12_9GAMM|nr:signal peptidase I [Alcanivorax hongdengensis]EKF73938.1 signal peptidase I [Alcanivorax hongdengensis A-11-3]
MDIDIGFWLTLLLAVTLVIWVADKLFRLKAKKGPVGSVVETSNSLISVFFVVLVIRSFIVEPFTIPSGSMLPTLQVHDFILVSKFSYGLRLPITNTKIIETGEPKRGDVMVFKYPKDRSINFIKRVVGLPGDRVVVRDNQLTINGKLVARDLVNEKEGNGIWHREYVEQLGHATHLIWQQGRINPYTGQKVIPSRTQGEWIVPDGHYFVMGDNRDNSNDSRFWGMVPEKLVVGRAFLIWMHWDGLTSLPHFSRNGSIDQVEAK